MLLRRWRLLVAVATLAIGMVIWTSTLSPKRPLVMLKSIKINYWNVSMGHDSRGLPTSLLTSKSTVVLKITNGDDFWGYSIKGLMTMNIFLRKISSTTIGQFYEPRKTTTEVTVELRSSSTPLYGASPSVAYGDGDEFYIFFEAALQTEAGFLPFMYKYTFTDTVTCTLTGTSAGPNRNLAIVATGHSCPRLDE